MDEGLLVFAFIAVLLFLLLILPNIKILNEYERAAVFRLGRLIGAKGPGIVILIPIIDRIVKVDLREAFIEVKGQRCITKDNAPVDVDVLIYYRVVNPEDSVVKVRDFRGATFGIAQTTLRSVIGDIVLDDLLAKREYINTVLRDKLDEITERWGVKVTSVELREVIPPKKVQDAMVKQIEAERERRAMVTEAEGRREATIKVAEGEARSEVLKAEGEREAWVMEAEGERAAIILEAEGKAAALERIFESAKEMDDNTLLLYYLKALEDIGGSDTSRLFIPMDFSMLTGLISRNLQKTKIVKENEE
ncbi:MAG: SPFH domain-containing protein [Candidatus Jordarchaeales archaeon]|nr:SPFH/Band 7/PHB domain protein [Candidatus Jordarchaeia archaeon]